MRPLETPGKPLDQTVRMPCNASMLAFIDSARGERTRARYLRDLVRAEALRVEALHSALPSDATGDDALRAGSAAS